MLEGGSVVSLMAVWRAHGLPQILRECWEAGVVLAAGSAGSLCSLTACVAIIAAAGAWRPVS
jgi:peptidase E